MTAIDIEYLKGWVGRESHREDLLASSHARLLAATLGQPQEGLQYGMPLPPLWHWAYFLEGLPPAELGRDGHPARGGFLPPVPLANRMWAGGQLEFSEALPLGSVVSRRSRIDAVAHKRGRSGDLVFVTVVHKILHQGRVVLTESHDIVYKDPAPPGLPAPSAAMPSPVHSERFEPDSTMLFRYSALTFNGHRIHYDADYCREVEGYASLVIHGPLIATALAGFAQRLAGRPLRTFRYRGLRPSLLGQALSLRATPSGPALELWAEQPDGAVSMQALASFA